MKSIEGFSKLSKQAKLEWIANNFFANPDEVIREFQSYWQDDPATQKLFDEFKPGELGITPMKFDNSFFCKACGSMGTGKTCPHDSSNHVSLSGTRVREMLAAGEIPPVEFSRPEVAKILIEAARAPR